MIEHSLYTIEQLQSMTSSSAFYKENQTSEHLNIRLTAIKDAALSLGAQSSLAVQSKKIDDFLISYSNQLEQIFNFNQILLADNVLPPVISDSNNSVKVSFGAQSITAAGRTYKIVRQVKFVTAPPTWRDYLYMPYSKPELPNKILLPKTDEEKQIWDYNLVVGWNNGIKQAMAIYKINLNTLVRDYTGMVLYKKLLTEDLITPVYVSKRYNGITGNKNKVMIDDQSMKIKSQPKLKVKSGLWKPVVGKSND